MNKEELERIYNLVTPGRTVAHYVDSTPMGEDETSDLTVKFVVSSASLSFDSIRLNSAGGTYTTCEVGGDQVCTCTHLTDGDTVIWRRE